MIWLALLVAVVIAVITVAAVLGRVDGSLGDATTTMSHVPLPDDPLTPGDLDGLRFDTAMRGYRMSEVDGVVDRLRREIADLSDQLDRARHPSRLADDSRPAGELSRELVRELGSGFGSELGRDLGREPSHPAGPDGS